MDSSSDLVEQFNKATNYVLGHSDSIDQEALIKMYGLFKQATVGSCNTPKPSWFDYRAKLKWKSWNKCSHMSKSYAMREYIKILDNAAADWNQSDSNVSTNGIFVSSMCATDQVLAENQKTIFDWIKEGNLEKLKTKDFDPNCQDDEGLALLHWAADRGDFRIVRYLIEYKKANVDCLDNEGQTPLHYAAACGYPNVVEYLIKAGANCKITDNDNNTPKDVAEDDDILGLFS